MVYVCVQPCHINSDKDVIIFYNILIINSLATSESLGCLGERSCENWNILDIKFTFSVILPYHNLILLVFKVEVCLLYVAYVLRTGNKTSLDLCLLDPLFFRSSEFWLFLKIILKYLLHADKTSLWAVTLLRSSMTNVTSWWYHSSLSILNDLETLLWKSFHSRQHFSDIIEIISVFEKLIERHNFYGILYQN